MHGAANKVYEVPLRADLSDDDTLFIKTFDAHGFEHPRIPQQTLEVLFGPFRRLTVAEVDDKVFIQNKLALVQRVLQPGYKAELAALAEQKRIAVIGMGQYHKDGITRNGEPLRTGAA